MAATFDIGGEKLLKEIEKNVLRRVNSKRSDKEGKARSEFSKGIGVRFCVGKKNEFGGDEFWVTMTLWGAKRLAKLTDPEVIIGLAHATKLRVGYDSNPGNPGRVLFKEFDIEDWKDAEDFMVKKLVELPVPEKGTDWRDDSDLFAQFR